MLSHGENKCLCLDKLQRDTLTVIQLGASPAIKGKRFLVRWKSEGQTLRSPCLPPRCASGVSVPMSAERAKAKPLSERRGMESPWWWWREPTNEADDRNGKRERGGMRERIGGRWGSLEDKVNKACLFDLYIHVNILNVIKTDTRSAQKRTPQNGMSTAHCASLLPLQFQSIERRQLHEFACKF